MRFFPIFHLIALLSSAVVLYADFTEDTDKDDCIVCPDCGSHLGWQEGGAFIKDMSYSPDYIWYWHHVFDMDEGLAGSWIVNVTSKVKDSKNSLYISMGSPDFVKGSYVLRLTFTQAVFHYWVNGSSSCKLDINYGTEPVDPNIIQQIILYGMGSK